MKVVHAVEISCTQLIMREAGVAIVRIKSVRAVDRIMGCETIPEVVVGCESVAATTIAASVVAMGHGAVCEVMADGGMAVIDRRMSREAVAGEGMGATEMRSADVSATDTGTTKMSAATTEVRAATTEMRSTATEVRAATTEVRATTAEMRSTATEVGAAAAAAAVRSATVGGRRSSTSRKACYRNRDAGHEHNSKIARPVAQHGTFSSISWRRYKPTQA
ncbi:MAG TPA: hypothetical protein VMV19_16840 [Xanthobacteraceae bacterium]|nr:hypothetical protein [Xanthobacteraceae bacterium]